MKWIIFTYSLPAEPSRSRVYTWRQLKKLGAVNHQSVWVVPHSTDRINVLKKLIEETVGYKGSALLFAGNILIKSQEESIVQAFVDSRNEEEIEKLKRWLKKIEKRDILKPPLRKDATEKIKECEKIFNDFARRVYEHQKER